MEKFFRKSLDFISPFSTLSPSPTTPLTAALAPSIIPLKAPEPKPTIFVGSATIPLLTESKAPFTFSATPGIKPNKLARPRTQPVKASKDEPRNLPIPSAIFSKIPKIPFPTLEITSNTAKNMFLAPSKRKLNPLTNLIMPVMT